MKNLDGSLKNLFVLVQFALPNVFVLKRVPHIWLILTLLTLFSFQRTPNHLSAIVPLLVTVDVYCNTLTSLCQHIIFGSVRQPC